VPDLDAFKLKLKSGKVSRIGADEPSGLATALNAGRINKKATYSSR
jgi:hypothetical protein